MQVLLAYPHLGLVSISGHEPDIPFEQPPFIPTQRLWRLECPAHLRFECLKPETLWALPRDGDDSVRRPVPGLEQSCCWKLINPGDDATAAKLRSEFLASQSIRRLCLTIDAGVGKTVAMQQTQYLRQTGENRNALAVLVEFAKLDRLNGDASQFLGVNDAAVDHPGQVPLLIDALRDNPATRELEARQARRLLERLIRSDRFTLLVDALDQSVDFDNSRRACEALTKFLNRYPQVRCVVSGRPFAIRRYWEELLAHDESWQFVMVDVFRPLECATYLESERMKELERLGADVIAIPRTLQMIQEIPFAELRTLRSKGDVYRAALDGMLAKALRKMPKDVRLATGKAKILFSLVAFEMLRAGKRAGAAGIRDDKERAAFVADVRQRHRSRLNN